MWRINASFLDTLGWCSLLLGAVTVKMDRVDGDASIKIAALLKDELQALADGDKQRSSKGKGLQAVGVFGMDGGDDGLVRGADADLALDANEPALKHHFKPCEENVGGEGDLQ